ncbi:hypothetical protein M426DRAFT_267087 [Hypoxylon sp. CI-4A]|nr:hypothetical protein M426DRAFT_267087 [Hypoxylon sp. CI-4A]
MTDFATEQNTDVEGYSGALRPKTPKHVAASQRANTALNANSPSSAATSSVGSTRHDSSSAVRTWRLPPVVLNAILESLILHVRHYKLPIHSAECYSAVLRHIQCILPDDLALEEVEVDSPERRETTNTTSRGPILPSSNSNRNRAGSRQLHNRRYGRDHPDRRGQRPPHASGISRPAARPQRQFACPFYLQHRLTYEECRGYTLTRVSDVRQHIRRRHVQQDHCIICGTVFIYPTDREGHDAYLCHPNLFYFPGATAEQIAQMGSRAGDPSARSEEERWYQIWAILFPNSPSPESPYLSVHPRGSRGFSAGELVLQDARDAYLNYYNTVTTTTPSQLAPIILDSFIYFITGWLQGHYDHHHDDNHGTTSQDLDWNTISLSDLDASNPAQHSATVTLNPQEAQTENHTQHFSQSSPYEDSSSSYTPWDESTDPNNGPFWGSG